MTTTKIRCKILAVDLSSLIFRSFYGLPTSIKDSEGNAINAVKGYLETLNRLKNLYSPEIIIHALDEAWRPKWRTDLLPEYKAHRVLEDNEEEVDDDLERQIELLPSILQTLGMQSIGIRNYEADDVLASIAKKNGNTIIVSGDRDLFQTIDDKRKIYVHLLGKDGGILFDRKEIIKRFGLDVNSYLDFAVLKGDASDGLPGVKGIGEKTALNIIKEFDNITNLISTFDKSKKLTLRQKQTISDSIPYLRKAYKVVKLENNLKIKLIKTNKEKPEIVFKKLRKYKIDNQIKYFI